MKKPSGGVRSVSKGLHPRNRHQGLYDFEVLIQVCPELQAFVKRSPRDDLTLDFANPAAVMTLNRALLKSFYEVSSWEIPKGFLCPPVPGRADHLHYLADLLATSHEGVIPRGPEVRVLDIGVGANCIYPIIGHHEYGWSFVGTETDPVALRSAQQILEANPKLAKAVELRLQKSPANILKGIISGANARTNPLSRECFELVMCNPPFHASWEEAQAGSERKWKNLGRAPKSSKQAPVLNFGGKSSELWCPGGEVAFVRRMIEESKEFADQVRWFTSLVSKETTLPAVHGMLRRVGVAEVRVIDMTQGQKKSRILAWTFSDL